MESNGEEAVDNQSEYRRTRSGRLVKTPTVANKQASRKTRKKMVLMEVEVSEDEEPEEEIHEPINISLINPEELALPEQPAEDPLNDTNDNDENNSHQNGDEIEQLFEEVDEEPQEAMEVDKSEFEEFSDVQPEESEDVVAINEESLEAVQEDSLEAAPEENLEAVNEDSLEAVNEGSLEAVNEESLEAVNEESLEAVNEEGLETLNEEGLEAMNEEGLEALNEDGLEAVNEESLEAEPQKENQIIQSGDPDAENISEDELPSVQVAKVPETEEVSDEELPGPKRAELPADTEVVSEDEFPSVKKEGTKRKLGETDYDPGSPTSENEIPTKKQNTDGDVDKEKEEKKPKKLPELDKYWKAVNDDPADFTGWTYLLQYVDQENDMEAAREAYDAFLSHYPYCYGYWRKYADYEKRKGNKKKCEEVFERGLKAIPLSVDLWIHYLTYVRSSRPDDEDFIRSQFERALGACGLEFRSDRLWDSFIKWETEGKRLQNVTAIYDRLLTTPTQGYTSHFDNFQEHITSNPPNKVLEVDEFLALRKEVKHMLKHDTPTNTDNPDIPPGEDNNKEAASTDEETKAIRERIVSIRRKIHKNTVTAVTARWNFEEGIKRPYFHVKPLERCQLKNWQEYLDYEIEQGDRERIITLFERCLIACALYEEFWLRFVHYLEGLNDSELQSKIKDVYERACTIHHLKKPSLHLQWAMFEESVKNYNKAAEILLNLEKSVPNLLQVTYRRINLERRRGDFEKCSQLYEQYITSSKSKVISSNLAIKYSRFCLKLLNNAEKAVEILNLALTKDPCNQRLYLQLIDLALQKQNDYESEVLGYIDAFLEKEAAEIDQKVLFAQRKLEFLEDFGSDIQCVQKAYDEYQKYIKVSKEKKKDTSKSDSTSKKEKTSSSTSQSNSYGTYGNYGNSSSGSYQYSSSQSQYNYAPYSQDQYQYGNWQYPQGSYGGYNQWGSYGSGYGY